MWKRDESVKPANVPTTSDGQSSDASGSSKSTSQQQSGGDVVHIGKSVVIKGELNGSEDLTIEGQVEGKIELKDHVLTIGSNGKIKAQVFAKALIVLGEVNGNISASDKVEIRDGGAVDGDIVSPRVAIAEGAHFRGSVDMQRKGGTPSAQLPVRPLGQATPSTPPQAQPQTQTQTAAPGAQPVVR
jgi:cytoskeletal protein CcmA (bactofilin family)